MAKSMGWDPGARVSLGDTVFEVADGVLIRADRRVSLPPKQLEVLRLLVAAAPHLVTREELLDRVWADRVVGDAALSQAVKELRQALGDDARAPRYIATVSRRGYRLVAQVTPLAPAAEPAPPGHGAAAGNARPWRRAAGAAALAVVAVAGIGLLALRWRSGRAGRDAGAPGTPRRAVAVLGFRDLRPAPESAWIGAALTEFLATELAAGQRLRVVSGDLVARVVRENPAAAAGGAAIPERIRRALAADIVIAGAYALAAPAGAGAVRVDLRAVDAASGAEAFTLSDSAATGEVLGLIGRLGAALRDRLGVGALAPAEESALRAAHPRREDAARLYAEGFARMREYSYPAARDLLERAAAVEPDSPLIRSALARAWSWLGHEGRETEEARRAFELSGSLARGDQLRIEAHLRERLGERERALEIARALFAFYPDDPEVGLDLALALAGAGKVPEASATLDALRALPAPLGEDPRIDLVEAWVADAEPARRRAAADRAAAKAEAGGASLLLAYARIQQGEAWRSEGEMERAAAAISDAVGIRRAAGDRWGVAKGLTHLGVLQADRGEVAAAETTLAGAASEAREIGSVWSEAEALYELGNVQMARYRTAAAGASFERALALFEEAGRAWSVSRVRLALAEIGLEAGDVSAAEATAATIADACRAAGHHETEALALHLGARAALAHADSGAAAPAVERARRALVAAGGGSLQQRLALDVLGAEIARRAGRVPEGREAARAAAAQAEHAGLLAVELEARLELAAAELAGGRERAGQAMLAAVIDRARAAGLERLARRAAAMS